mgnify:CR=1 FL=1
MLQVISRRVEKRGRNLTKGKLINCLITLVYQLAIFFLGSGLTKFNDVKCAIVNCILICRKQYKNTIQSKKVFI